MCIRDRLSDPEAIRETPIEILIDKDSPKTAKDSSRATNTSFPETQKHLSPKPKTKQTVSNTSRPGRRKKRTSTKDTKSSSRDVDSVHPNKATKTSSILGFQNKAQTSRGVKGSGLKLDLPSDWTVTNTKQSSPTGQPLPSSIPKTWIRRRNGTYKIEKPGFEITVKQDGSVTFKDDPDFAVKIALPSSKAIACSKSGLKIQQNTKPTTKRTTIPAK